MTGMSDREQPAAAGGPSGGASPSARPGTGGGPTPVDGCVLALGEVLVDMICERPAASFGDVDAFVPHVGGAIANVCVVVARHGGRAALGGVVGADAWGTWLARRLADEGVGLEWLLHRDAVTTPVAFVTVSAEAEPAYAFYGAGLTPGFGALADTITTAVDACDALFFGTSMQVEPAHRAVTQMARARARERGIPIVFDPNVRLSLWTDPAEAIAVARADVPGTFLVKANRDEVRLLTGDDDPETGARALLALGASNVVVTLGADGALLVADGVRQRVAGPRVQPVNATGAGDTIAGVLLARLGRHGYSTGTLEQALPEAVVAAARSTESWGAVS